MKKNLKKYDESVGFGKILCYNGHIGYGPDKELTNAYQETKTTD